MHTSFVPPPVVPEVATIIAMSSGVPVAMRRSTSRAADSPPSPGSASGSAGIVARAGCAAPSAVSTTLARARSTSGESSAAVSAGDR